MIVTRPYSSSETYGLRDANTVAARGNAGNGTIYLGHCIRRRCPLALSISFCRIAFMMKLRVVG